MSALVYVQFHQFKQEAHQQMR